MKRLLVVAMLCACSACDVKIPFNPPVGGGAGGNGGSGGGGGGVESTTPPLINTTVFTSVGAGAGRLLADVGNARLEIDPTQKDALTALGECADLLSYCYAPGTATLTQCFDRARKCETPQPWNEQPCCPDACKTAFESEVAGGMTHVDALEKVLFREPDCFPGVRAAVENP